MDDDNYKLEDALNTALASIQEIERRLLRAALKGGISPDTKRQLRNHCLALQQSIDKLPLEER